MNTQILKALLEYDTPVTNMTPKPQTLRNGRQTYLSVSLELLVLVNWIKCVVNYCFLQIGGICVFNVYDCVWRSRLGLGLSLGLTRTFLCVPQHTLFSVPRAPYRSVPHNSGHGARVWTFFGGFLFFFAVLASIQVGARLSSGWALVACFLYSFRL